MKENDLWVRLDELSSELDHTGIVIYTSDDEGNPLLPAEPDQPDGQITST